LAGPLAVLLNAVPLFELQAAPGETVDLPRLAGYAGPLAAVAGRRGGVRAERAVTIHLDLPDPALRVAHWTASLDNAELARELGLVESRCRHRERLHETVGASLGAQLTPGVRALFSGPSGTGKTLAARLLAGALGKELFALDLSTVVNKYLGETEKNLDAV